MDHKIHKRTHFKSLLRGEKESALDYQKLVREETMEWAHPAFKDCLVQAPVDRVGIEDPGCLCRLPEMLDGTCKALDP